jgi:hypothetical protein
MSAGTDKRAGAGGPSQGPAARRERLATALRENLRKRKAQARGRGAAAGSGLPAEAETDETPEKPPGRRPEP